jgi:predicted Zn-dependent peptidase
MLFKGTTTRRPKTSRRRSIDRRTARRLHGEGIRQFYIKVLDEHPPWRSISCQISLNPAFGPDDIQREKKVVLEEIKMVEDTPDDLVHELFTQASGVTARRPILGRPETVESFDADLLRRYFRNAYTAQNFIISAVAI